MALTRLRNNLDALRTHVERVGHACDEVGLGLTDAVLEEAGKWFYALGNASEAGVEEAHGLDIHAEIRGGVVWITLPELMDGAEGLVCELVRVPRPK